VPHVIQPAATARSKCRGCGKPIGKGELRFGESVPNPFADGETTRWFHLACGAYKRPEAFLPTLEARAEAVDAREALVAEAKAGIEHRRLPRVDAAERATTGRATCRHCKAPIEKDAWRIGLVFYEDERFNPAGYIHPGCALAYLETAELMARLKQFSKELTEADWAAVEAELRSPTKA
jgi:Poly(ADP-ribose) polymerase and DNA-Ligase Zn-finger region